MADKADKRGNVLLFAYAGMCLHVRPNAPPRRLPIHTDARNRETACSTASTQGTRVPSTEKQITKPGQHSVLEQAPY